MAFEAAMQAATKGDIPALESTLRAHPSTAKASARYGAWHTYLLDNTIGLEPKRGSAGAAPLRR